MTESAMTLAPLFSGWREYQQKLVAAVAPLTPEQLALGIGPHLRPISILATHIVSVRAGWLYFTLEVRDPRLAPFAAWAGDDQPPRDAAELVGGLEATWAVIEDALSGWTLANLEDQVWDEDETGQRIPLTRQWVLWHLVEHDMHHGGELSYTLGLHGLTGIDI